MDKRALMWALVVAVVATGVYFLTSRYLVSRLDGTGGVVATEQPGQYSSAHVGVAFTYPDKYELESRHVGEGHLLTLLPKDYVPPQNGDGPAAITVQEFNNAEDLPLDTFIQNEPMANFSLSDGKTTPTTIGGQPALMYAYSGLYENDAYAVAANGRVYVFATGWTSADDPLRQEPKDLIKTVTFINDAR